MKTIKKKRRNMLGRVAVGCAVGLMVPSHVTAAVSDADFNALKQQVQELSGQLQSLEQTNQQLQAQLGETQKTATDAEQKSEAAAQSADIPRVPIDETTVNHNFQILGDAEFQFAKASGQNAAFQLADFAPIFLYRGGDNILFEAGFDFVLQNNGGTPGTLNDSTGAPAQDLAGNNIPNANGTGYTTTINLSFAQLDYVMTDYTTLCVGDLVLPLGTYSERSAGWLNKFPDNPLAVDALIPGTGVGAELRGAIPVGESGKFINYAVYGVNGPGSADGTGNAAQLDIAGGNVGFDSNGSAHNLHGKPTGGGRLGLFIPLKPHCDLELGISGQSGEWDNAGSHLWTAGVFDAALHLGSSLEVKCEYIQSQFGSDDLGGVRQQGWFVQAGYKLAGLNLELPVINNVELVGRYDSLQNAYDSGNNAFDFNVRRSSVGYIYYITSALLFEGDYEFLNSNDPSQVDQMILQLSYGF
jgi:outer membrane murein-binding lipoprotein Lpp